jgi:hypothetical protein
VAGVTGIKHTTRNHASCARFLRNPPVAVRPLLNQGGRSPLPPGRAFHERRPPSTWLRRHASGSKASALGRSAGWSHRTGGQPFAAAVLFMVRCIDRLNATPACAQHQPPSNSMATSSGRAWSTSASRGETPRQGMAIQAPVSIAAVCGSYEAREMAASHGSSITRPPLTRRPMRCRPAHDFPPSGSAARPLSRRR